jgi:hypothetical protein
LSFEHEKSLRRIDEKHIFRFFRFVHMSLIIWAAALVAGVSFLVFVKRKIRRRRESSRSLSHLGTVSQQWLTGHRAEN